MSLKDQSIQSISNGAWVFEILGPGFRRALANRVGVSSAEASRLTTATLTQRAYTKVAPAGWNGFDESSGALKPDSMTSEDRSLLASVVLKVHEGALPAEFAPKEQELLSNARQVLNKYSVETGELLTKWISSLCKVNNTPFRSASHPHSFGCIFLGERFADLSPAQLSISLVHEMAHQELFLLNIIDRLVTAEADYKLVHAPFQGVNRPTIGRLHSLYALFRMIQFQDLLGVSSHHHRELHRKTMSTFAESDLTDFGKQLIQVTADRLAPSARVAFG
jgi:HEXXH motif-containing protein